MMFGRGSCLEEEESWIAVTAIGTRWLGTLWVSVLWPEHSSAPSQQHRPLLERETMLFADEQDWIVHS